MLDISFNKTDEEFILYLAERAGGGPILYDTVCEAIDISRGKLAETLDALSELDADPLSTGTLRPVGKVYYFDGRTDTIVPLPAAVQYARQIEARRKEKAETEADLVDKWRKWARRHKVFAIPIIIGFLIVWVIGVVSGLLWVIAYFTK